MKFVFCLVTVLLSPGLDEIEMIQNENNIKNAQHISDTILTDRILQFQFEF